MKGITTAQSFGMRNEMRKKRSVKVSFVIHARVLMEPDCLQQKDSK